MLAGSESCRKCHAAFYQKWSTSFHGLAMRPYSPAYAREHLKPMDEGLEIQGRTYRAVIGTASDHVEETGPRGGRRIGSCRCWAGRTSSTPDAAGARPAAGAAGRL